MSMRIITGATGTAHVTSNDDGSINMGIFGSGNGVLKNGNKLEATIIDNNTIRLKDGDIIMQGRVGRVDANTTEDIAISTGAVGENRNDLICVRYSMDNTTGYESMNLVVVEGTPSTASASDPTYNTGDIRTGASIVDFPLYRVKLTGINIESVDCLFNEIAVGSISARDMLEPSEAAPRDADTLGGLYSANDITTINENLTTFHYRKVDGQRQISDDGETWENFNSGAELLWTNSAPTTAFAPQTISLNLSDYNYLIFEMKYYASESASQTSKTIVDKGVTRFTFGSYNASYSSKRQTSSNNNSVVFGSGVNNTGSTDNNACIPLKIYGLKNNILPS